MKYVNTVDNLVDKKGNKKVIKMYQKCYMYIYYIKTTSKGAAEWK
ncbi:MAG: hypothetical protein ACRDB0_06840 [Paraclostridium sp.]